MKLTYDPESDAMYIKLTDTEFEKVKIVNKNTILNLDSEGNVIGIELLFVSKHLLSNFLSQVIIENLNENK